jgi:hypothetical protein
MADTYQSVRDALREGDKALARQRLKQIGVNSIEASYLRALASENPTEFEQRYRKLKNVAPNHPGVKKLIQLFEASQAAGRRMDNDAYLEIPQEHIRREFGRPDRQAARNQPETNVYEMLWDCQYCGSKKLLGLTHRFCPNCGAAQNPDARYYPSDEEKVAVHNHEYTGVDVTCSACGQLNGAKSEFCGQCGAPLSEAAKAKTLAAETRAQGEQFASGGSRDVVKEQYDAEMARIGATPKKKKRGGNNNVIIAAVIAVVVLLIGGGFFLLNWTEEASLVVTGHEWERSIDIERYNEVRERSWHDSRPSGDDARIISGTCREEQRSTRRVPDGEDCSTRRVDQGDGTFREERVCTTRYREEPVYDDMCTWEVKRWEWERTASASGGLSDTPYWPETNVSPCSSTRVGCERETNRNEDYQVVFESTDNENVYRCDFEPSIWSGIALQTTWTGQVRVVDSGALLCDTLEQN